MGTASRKTWLEKQPDEVQVFVLSMDEQGKTLEEMRRALEGRCRIVVPNSTLGNALKIYHDTQDLRWAGEWAADLEKLIEENPHIQAAKLAKGFLTQKMASASFRGEPMKASEVVFFAQKERQMDIDERKTKAVEKRNELEQRRQDLKQQELEVTKQKIASATGGMDGQALYLQASQDVLKKLRTYQDLKPGLDQHQEEIIAELAHSAESFTRKLEQSA
jgi:hypothetical protein